MLDRHRVVRLGRDDGETVRALRVRLVLENDARGRVGQSHIGIANGGTGGVRDDAGKRRAVLRLGYTKGRKKECKKAEFYDPITHVR